MSLTLSNVKGYKTMQLQNQPACMVDHLGLKPVCLNVFSLQKHSTATEQTIYWPLRLRAIQQYISLCI